MWKTQPRLPRELPRPGSDAMPQRRRSHASNRRVAVPPLTGQFQCGADTAVGDAVLLPRNEAHRVWAYQLTQVHTTFSIKMLTSSACGVSHEGTHMGKYGYPEN